MSAAAGNAGVLAIWNDCVPGAEDEYEHWYRREHLAERVAIEGFVAGWRYLAVEGEPRYFTHYETLSPQVLFSNAYLARVNDPTPLTRRVMSDVFVDMSRTVCERRLRFGDARGGFAAALRLASAPDPAAAAVLIEAEVEATGDEVLRGELWIAVDAPAPPPSAEQRLRGPDAQIGACVLLETADASTARAALRRLGDALPGASHAGVYRLMCSLHRADQR